MLQDIGVCAMREMGEASAAAGQLPASQKRHQQHQQQPSHHWEQHQPAGHQGQGTSKARLQERLVAASRLIQDHGLRVSRLEAFGCYSELALVVKARWPLTCLACSSPLHSCGWQKYMLSPCS
jgi:hypothetical protein